MAAGADEVRAYRQPQDRQGARSRRAALTLGQADKVIEWRCRLLRRMSPKMALFDLPLLPDDVRL